MQISIVATLLVAGVIHLLPLTGVLGWTHLQRLYGLGASTPDLELLLRHRAVLFGLLGAFLISAAFRPALQTIALAAALISVGSFVALAMRDGLTPELSRVFWIDVVLCAPLCVALGFSLVRQI